MELGEKIKYHREKLGLTLEELGNKVGVGKSTVRKWEKGIIANMRRDKIDKVAKALAVSPAYLMGWTDKPGPDYSLADNIEIAFWRDVDRGVVKLDDIEDEYELTEDEDEIISNYRKLSPIEKESIRNIIDKMANGATPSSSEKETTTTQVAPDVYTAAVKEVIVVSENGKKAQVVKLNADTPLSSIPALQKYNPKSAREALMQSANFTQSNTISKKTARKKENAQ